MKQLEIKSLADHQIKILIEKGKNVKELKDEWKKRWGMEYPYYKNCIGIQTI